MNINDFISAFAEEFEETPEDKFRPDTVFKQLGEWDSLMSLSILAMIDEIVGKRVTGSELRSCETIEDLYNLSMNK